MGVGVSMNYDAFVNEVKNYDSDYHVAKLLVILKDWKLNDVNVVEQSNIAQVKTKMNGQQVSVAGRVKVCGTSIFNK